MTKYVPLAAIVLPMIVAAQSGPRSQAGPPAGHVALPRLPGNHGPCGSCVAPAQLSSDAVIPVASEPGEGLDVHGTVYEPDGRTPAAAVGLFVYHTDASGYYNGWKDESDPRIRGWVRTDHDGRFEFRTIRPAPYAGTRMPAHIHITYWSARCVEHWTDDTYFGDDSLLPAGMRATAGKPFSQVLQPQRGSDGVWRATRDIRLPRNCGAERRP
jgi:protocatechuate 3,4-dioxygenase, beta subunit